MTWLYIILHPSPLKSSEQATTTSHNDNNEQQAYSTLAIVYPTWCPCQIQVLSQKPTGGAPGRGRCPPKTAHFVPQNTLFWPNDPETHSKRPTEGKRLLRYTCALTTGCLIFGIHHCQLTTLQGKASIRHSRLGWLFFVSLLTCTIIGLFSWQRMLPWLGPQLHTLQEGKASTMTVGIVFWKTMWQPCVHSTQIPGYPICKTHTF